MKASKQCGIAASKINQFIGLIKRNITYKERQLIIPLYKLIVRVSFGILHTSHIVGLFPEVVVIKESEVSFVKEVLLNGYEDTNRNMLFKLKEGSTTRGHKAALVKEQCWFDMRKNSFSQRTINEWDKLFNDCLNGSSVIIFKNETDRHI